MAKAKIIMTIELEYEIIPQNYEKTDDTDEKRLAYDVEAYKEMPDLLMENEKSVWTFKSELLNGGTNHDL